MNLSKYFVVTKLTWDEIFTYRLNFVIWRFRSVLSLLTIYFLWFSVIPKDTNVLGYTQSLMLTYVVGAYFVGAIVFSTRTFEIAENINNGDLSIFLLRPINYFFYWFTKDLGDKAVNITFSIVELLLFLLFIHPPFFIQTDVFMIIIFFIAVFLAILIIFFINILISFGGFWSPEIWAPRFIFLTLVTFLAGIWFPLDILPKFFFEIIKLLPFTYLLYFPVKIYLGQLPLDQIYFGFTVSLLWIAFLYLLVRFVWKRGLRLYVAYGR